MRSVDRRRADVHAHLPGPPRPRPVALSLMWQVGKWGAERASISPQGPAAGDPTGHGPAGLPADAVLGPSFSQSPFFLPLCPGCSALLAVGAGWRAPRGSRPGPHGLQSTWPSSQLCRIFCDLGRAGCPCKHIHRFHQRVPESRGLWWVTACPRSPLHGAPSPQPSLKTGTEVKPKSSREEVHPYVRNLVHSVLQTPPHRVLKGSRQEECWMSKVRPPPCEPTSLQEQLASPGGGAWPECPTCSGLLGYRSRRSSAASAHAKRNISDAQLGCSQASATGCLPCLLTHSRRAKCRRPRSSGPEKPTGKARGMGAATARPPGPLSSGGHLAFWAERATITHSASTECPRPPRHRPELGSLEPGIQQQVPLGKALAVGCPQEALGPAGRASWKRRGSGKRERRHCRQREGRTGKTPGRCAVTAVSLGHHRCRGRSVVFRELQRPLEWTLPLGWGQHTG